MRALFRSVTRLLLLVMLATVLSPSFGWEAVQGMAPHGGHDEAPAVHSHDVHQAYAAETAHAACGSDCDMAAAEHCNDSRHHCCPGVMFGHLLGGPAESFQPAVFAGASAVPVGRDARFSSRVPDGLERPPRAVLA